MLKLIAVLLVLWIGSQSYAIVSSIERHDYVNQQFCTQDRTLVGILDPGYKTLSKTARSTLQIDITAIVNEAPCTITYIPLPKGT